jgi:hypothetical protein
MMKGNSGSGAAAAEVESATPIASAPKAAAARREFSLSASRLNSVDPYFPRLAPFRRVVGAFNTGRTFQEVCAKGTKRFRRGKELFRHGVVARQT